MEIIPVIDIKNGIAVSGKSGLREKYTGLKTIFATSPDPVEIVKKLPFKRLYVADLDGIMRGDPNHKMLEELSRLRKLMVDAGIRTIEDYHRISGLDAEIIIGSETLRDFRTLDAIYSEHKNIIFSVDIKDGKVMSHFLPPKPNDAVELLLDRIKRLLILDISSVGTLSLNFSLLEPLKGHDLEFYYGGGIKKEDIKNLKKMGIEGALVGTALHQGLM
ncbi:MAG: HisA/HisF-related TIM barrel protein [Candidatus Hydrothermarchaeaceae archaeon]